MKREGRPKLKYKRKYSRSVWPRDPEKHILDLLENGVKDEKMTDKELIAYKRLHKIGPTRIK